ncbi:MAG: DUF4352 domain-containing protein [Solobacterium sp.]|nr:DUF4352 domain-containing protein [Solobacterium sp.]
MKKILSLICAVFLLVLAGCSEEPKTEGTLGDTLHTMFFDITVRNARKADELNEMTPMDEGYHFLIAGVTVKNTTDETIPMGDVDFIIRWGTGDENWDYPATVYTDTALSEDQFPAEYKLKEGEEKTGTLVWIVPKDKTSFILETQDQYTVNKDEEAQKGQVYTITFNTSDPAE